MSKLSTEDVNVRIVDAEDLRSGVKRLYHAAGLSGEDAGMIADCMVMAHLRGVDTHGIRFVTQYYERYRTGSLNKSPSVKIVKETPNSALVDGDNGTGQVVGTKCMRIAIEKAKQTGIGMVSVYETNHFGAAAFYSMMAQAENLIGITATNASSAMAPTGGKTKTYGNNPWSFAFPYREGGIPIVVDMATSVVANSNIHIAKRIGEKIPLTWGLDKDGKPTDDPQKVWMLQPMAGYKGYAISLVVEVMAAVLNGHSHIATDNIATITEKDTKGRLMGHGGNIGQFYAAINPEMFVTLDEFYDRIAHLVDCVKQSELIEGVEEVFLPGEKEHRFFKERSKNGIPVNIAFLEDMNNICAVLGVDPV